PETEREKTERERCRRRLGVGKKSGKPWQRIDRGGGGVGCRWEHTGGAYLIDGIDPMPAAAFADIKRILENRLAAEIVVFARFVTCAIGHTGLRIRLRDRKAELEALGGAWGSLLLPDYGGFGIAGARRYQLHASVVDDIGRRRRSSVSCIA